MSNGAYFTLDAFSWNSSQTPSVQQGHVQSALDSGEPLLLPRGEIVAIDSGLVAHNPLHLVGHGGDATNSSAGLSQIRSVASNIDILTILSSNCILEYFDVNSSTSGCRGIVVGDGNTTPTNLPLNTQLRGLTTNTNLAIGCDVLDGEQLLSEHCHWKATQVGFRANNQNSGTGDSRVAFGSFYVPQGTGFELLPGGGGWRLESIKFNDCINHGILNGAVAPGGGVLGVNNCDHENCLSTVSWQLIGSNYFERVMFSNNTWANPSTAISAPDTATPWMHQVLITDNHVVVLGPNALSGFDIGGCDKAFITDNDIDLTGFGYTGMIVRPGCASGWIGPNLIRNVATGHGYLPIYNQGNGGSGLPIYSPQP